MPNELEFIRHCDDDLCDLGSAEYTCPSCGKYIVDYGDLWWEYFDGSTLMTKGVVGTSCPECGEVLVVTQNKKDYTYEIEIYKDEDE
jgi:YgiT-type zinc finger domain-containing protein